MFLGISDGGLKHGKALTDEVMQKTSSNPERTSKSSEMSGVLLEGLTRSAVSGRICPVSDGDLSKHAALSCLISPAAVRTPEPEPPPWSMSEKKQKSPRPQQENNG